MGQEDREQLDILFLDISMDVTDGMETAEQIRDWKEEREEVLWGSLPLLIFVTGYPEYMPKAFFVNAFQYLVKPIDEKEFEDVFARAARGCRCINRKKNTEPGEILVRSGHITRNVPVNDIYYIESCNRKIIVSMRDEEIECYGKIQPDGSTDEKWETPPDFQVQVRGFYKGISGIHCGGQQMSFLVSFVSMVLILKRIVRSPVSMSWQDAVFLSALNVVGSMLAWMIMDISMVQIDKEIFFLFAQRKEMVWKIPMIAALLSAGEISAICIFQKYKELQGEGEAFCGRRK